MMSDMGTNILKQVKSAERNKTLRVILICATVLLVTWRACDLAVRVYGPQPTTQKAK